MDTSPQDNGASPFSGLYKTGSVAALTAALIFRRNLDAEWLLLRGLGIVDTGPSAAPSSAAGWFALLQDQPLLGMTMLGLFDLVNYALVGLVILALAAALWKADPSRALLAAVLGLVGVTSYFASNQSFSLLWLSQQYAAASGESQRLVILAAGQAALAIHQNATYSSQGIYLGFLLVSAAGLILALSMRASPDFSKRTANVGVLANGLQLAYYIPLLIAPHLVAIPISTSAVFLLVWYLQIARGLWKLGRDTARRRVQQAAQPILS